MKKSYWIVSIVGIALALGVYAVPAIAQSTAQPATPFPNLVAVIDVAQVIRAHPEFVSRQQGLQEQVRAAEAAFQKRQEGIADMQKRLEASPHRPGSPQHQQQLDEIAYALAEFEKDAKTQQRRFALDNSRIMYDTYQDIKKTIGQYATARGIAQVTDYREFEVNPTDPQTVAEDMDQRLVWYSPNLNITQVIIHQIYASRNLPVPQQQANAAGAARTATAPAPNVGPVQGVPVQR